MITDPTGSVEEVVSDPTGTAGDALDTTGQTAADTQDATQDVRNTIILQSHKLFIVIISRDPKFSFHAL